MKTIAALCFRIERDVAFEPMDVIWTDALDEARRVYKTDSKELIDLVNAAAAFYEKNGKSQRSEGIYKQHIEELSKTIKNGLNPAAGEPRAVAALNEDIQRLAALLESHGKTNEALEYRKQVIELSDKAGGKPLTALERFNLANSYRVNRMFDAARFEFNNAIGMTSDPAIHYRCHVGLGRLEADSKNFTAAIRYFRQALDELQRVPAIAPDWPNIQLELARANRSAGNLKEATEGNKKIIDFFEKQPAVSTQVYCASLAELVQIYIAQKKYDDAKLAIEKCVNATQRDRQIPKDFAISALRKGGDAFAARGKTVDAQVYYKRMVAVSSESPNPMLRFEVLLAYGRFLENKNSKAAVVAYESAIKELERAGRVDEPTDRSPYLRIAVAQRAVGNYKRAIELLDKAFKCGLNYRATFSDADTKSGTRAYRDANTFLRRVLQRTAETYSYGGKFKESDQFFRKAEELENVRSVNPRELQFLYESWSLNSWLSGDSAREADLLAKAAQQRKILFVNPRERLLESIKQLGAIYGKTALTDLRPTSGDSITVLDHMQEILGPTDLHYVSAVKHIANLFSAAELKAEAQSFNERADKAKLLALKNVSHSPF
mgnify:CR=1 FL=1